MRPDVDYDSRMKDRHGFKFKRKHVDEDDYNLNRELLQPLYQKTDQDCALGAAATKMALSDI